MDFFDLFHLQKPENKGFKDDSASEVARFFRELTPSPKAPIFHASLRRFSLSSAPKGIDSIHEIPLSERMERFVDTGLYQKAYQDMLNKEILYVKQHALAETHPELVGKISLKNISLDEDALNAIQNKLADLFLEAIFRKEEMKSAYLHLLDPQKSLTKTDIDVLKVCIFVRKHDLDFLTRKYGVTIGAFQSMIVRKATELSNMIGDALKQDPRAIISYGAECCRGITGFNRGEMALEADQWVARWLNPKMLKALVQAEKLTPQEGSKTKIPTQKDIRWTHRYQANFKMALVYYLFKSPTCARNVFQMVVPHISKMEHGMQEQVWAILFQKYKVDPSIQRDVISYISAFLAQNPSLEAQKTMYGMFVKMIPPETRADILGHMPFKTLKLYLTTFEKIYKNMPYIALQCDDGPTHMAWLMFREKELTDEQMKGILDKADPRTQRSFLFSPKKQMDSDLFLYMCDKFSHSPFYFWQWVRSFRSTHNLKETLAKIYPTMPPTIKENAPYIAAMNHHFDLVRECAIAGDTGSLSALKKVLGPKVFWESMLQESEEKISGVRSLCRQGKRGLLKLISDWPMPQQQALFKTPDSTGRTLLDECTGNLVRLVVQNIFKQPYQRDIIFELPTRAPQGADSKEPEAPQKPKQKIIPRQIIRLPVFEGHMAKMANNTKLVQEVEDAIVTLSKMSKAEIAAELREGWKHQGNLNKAPCAVKDIRGNNYRLGYLLSGDIDQGTGQIAILFFLTHAQYDIFLNKQADQVVRTAKTMMAAAKLPPPGPTGPMGGNERE